MIEIIPAILPKSFEELNDSMALVSGLVPIVQVDVCDGVFVPGKTWPYIKKSDPDFTKIIREEGGFPYWEELDFEVDLMVAPTEEIIHQWISAGAKRLIIHLESVDDIEEFIHEINGMLPDEDSFLYTELGVAINTGTPIDALQPIIEKLDFVQCMGIDKIGFQGQPFNESVIQKISSLRQRHHDVTISVDGGVSLANASRLIEAGANRLVVGSAIFESDDVVEALESFENLSQ